jgi:hypothetical protein
MATAQSIALRAGSLKRFYRIHEGLALKDNQGVELSKQLLTNQSKRGMVIWVAWLALLFMVTLGLWNAYAVFRQQYYVFGYVLIGCFLFLGRQAIFLGSSFKMQSTASSKKWPKRAIMTSRSQSSGITMY